MSDEDWMKNNKFMCRQHNFCHSRASNSEVKYHIWPKFKLVQDFIDMLITCKFDQDWIKISKLLSGKLLCSRACNSKKRIIKFELVRDFTPVMDTCKFKKVATKPQGSMGPTTFSPILSLWEFFLSLKG